MDPTLKQAVPWATALVGGGATAWALHRVAPKKYKKLLATLGMLGGGALGYWGGSKLAELGEGESGSGGSKSAKSDVDMGGKKSDLPVITPAMQKEIDSQDFDTTPPTQEEVKTASKIISDYVTNVPQPSPKLDAADHVIRSLDSGLDSLGNFAGMPAAGIYKSPERQKTEDAMRTVASYTSPLSLAYRFGPVTQATNLVYKLTGWSPRIDPDNVSGTIIPASAKTAVDATGAAITKSLAEKLALAAAQRYAPSLTPVVGPAIKGLGQAADVTSIAVNTYADVDDALRHTQERADAKKFHADWMRDENGNWVPRYGRDSSVAKAWADQFVRYSLPQAGRQAVAIASLAGKLPAGTAALTGWGSLEVGDLAALGREHYRYMSGLLWDKRQAAENATAAYMLDSLFKKGFWNGMGRLTAHGAMLHPMDDAERDLKRNRGDTRDYNLDRFRRITRDIEARIRRENPDLARRLESADFDTRQEAKREFNRTRAKRLDAVAHLARETDQEFLARKEKEVTALMRTPIQTKDGPAYLSRAQANDILLRNANLKR